MSAALQPIDDFPRAVCPVIAAYLRAYDERVDDERRADLCVFAVAAIGTRNGSRAVRERVRRCRAFRERVLGRAVPGFAWTPTGAAIRAVDTLQEVDDPDRRHALALEFADELLQSAGGRAHADEWWAGMPDLRRLVEEPTDEDGFFLRPFAAPRRG